MVQCPTAPSVKRTFHVKLHHAVIYFMSTVTCACLQRAWLCFCSGNPEEETKEWDRDFLRDFCCSGGRSEIFILLFIYPFFFWSPRTHTALWKHRTSEKEIGEQRENWDFCTLQFGSSATLGPLFGFYQYERLPMKSIIVFIRIKTSFLHNSCFCCFWGFFFLI